MIWAVLRRLGVKGVEVRKAEQLQNVDSLIIPGGESTTMAKLAEYYNLVCHSLSIYLISFSVVKCLEPFFLLDVACVLQLNTMLK